MMGISTEDKYLIKSLPENKKHGAKQLLKCFLTKCILLAAGRRTQAGDATEQWRDQWRRRLEFVVQQQGRYIEHVM